MMLFSGTASRHLAKKIGASLMTQVLPLDMHVFADGERRVRVSDNVLSQNTIVVQSTATPVDKHYMELFFIIDSLKRSGAKSVTAVIPYLGYARQDHVFRDGEAVSVSVVIKLLEAVGVDKVISVDLHTVRIPELFHIPFVHLSALPVFAGEIKKIASSKVLISPDMGGIARIKKLSELLGGMPYATIDKERDLVTGVVEAKSVSSEEDLAGKTAIIVDDMISSGNTIVKAASLLEKQNVRNIIVFATHAVFSEDAPKLLEESVVSKVYVTDTISVTEKKQFAKLQILSVADIIAKALKGA